MAAGGSSRALAVGVGFRPGTGTAQILAAVRAVVTDSACCCLATLDRRAEEPGLLGAARELDVPVLAFSAAQLAQVPVPHPSGRVAEATGSASVAEAAAVLAALGGPLVRPKRIEGGVTAAAARRG